MKQKIAETAPWVGMVLTVTVGFSYLMCAAHSTPEKITIRALAEHKRINIEELTPAETKVVEILLNQEVSPCGNNLSLAQSLVNPESCPLTGAAVEYILALTMQDYEVEEISARYETRYASLKGLDIPVDDSPVFGATDPAIRIVIFSDFECPHCARTGEALMRLTRAYPDKIQLVFKHFPLTEIHPRAELAARAAYAAHRQDRFWEMHDVLFSAQGAGIDPDKVRIMAIGLGLDVDQFEERLASDGAAQAIAADKAIGTRLGVDGTPKVFINGRLLEGGESALEARINEEFTRQTFVQQ